MSTVVHVRRPEPVMGYDLRATIVEAPGDPKAVGCYAERDTLEQAVGALVILLPHLFGCRIEDRT